MTTNRMKDKQRFVSLRDDQCQLCGAIGNDKRSLMIRYFYDIKEVVPEFISLFHVYVANDVQRQMYYLRTCKACRSDFLAALKDWASKCKKRRPLFKDSDGFVVEYDIPTRDEDGNIRDIPLHIYGTVVMVSEPEWRKHHGYDE